MATARHKYEIDMCTGSLPQKILLFSLPLMATGILQLLFNAADIIVVGRYVGSHALAAVGSNGSIINLIVNLFMGISIGGREKSRIFCGKLPVHISISYLWRAVAKGNNAPSLCILGKSLVQRRGRCWGIEIKRTV